jgi:hypothetical protein
VAKYNFFHRAAGERALSKYSAAAIVGGSLRPGCGKGAKWQFLKFHVRIGEFFSSAGGP